MSSINNANIGDVRATVEETTGNLVLTSVSGADITIKDTQAQSIVTSMEDVTSTLKLIFIKQVLQREVKFTYPIKMVL